MNIERLNMYRNSNIGVYSLANDEISILPLDVPDKMLSLFRENLGTEVLKTHICGSPLIGVFVACNSNGIVLPRFTRDSELEYLNDKLGDNFRISMLSSKKTALGNLILTNDRAAVVSPEMDKKSIKTIGETLEVEIFVMGIGGSRLVGSIANATNRGVLVFPTVPKEDISSLEERFGGVVDVGTVNGGNIFVGTGLVANSKGALVGEDTTGPELMRIQQVFFH